ncbi:MAG: type II toxin-antitoxin system HicA family toxin [Acidithiobacillus sp.]
MAVRALERLGFTKIRQSGSHVIMRRASKAVSFRCTGNQDRYSCGCSAPSQYIARRIHQCLVNLASNPAVDTDATHKAAQRCLLLRYAPIIS